MPACCGADMIRRSAASDSMHDMRSLHAVTGAEAQDVLEEELEWDDAGVVRVKEDKEAVKTEFKGLEVAGAVQEEAAMQED